MRMLLAGVVAAALGVGVSGPAPTAVDIARPTGSTRVVAAVPSPGHPAYVHAHTNGRIYVGTYKSGDGQASRVIEYSGRGTLLRSWTVPGQRLAADPGVQAANQTADGDLVLLETSRRAVMTLDLRTGRFRTVATLPPGAVPNYATWTPFGLLVSDYAQGVLWRVGRGGAVSAWYRSPALEGVAGFGTTGLVYRARERDLLITQQTVSDGSDLPTNGALYRLTLDGDRPGRLRTLWRSAPTDLPDGFGVGRSGRIYIANAGLTNQIVVLSPTGQELRRLPELPGTGENGSPIPFDTPCSATFRGTEILVANQSAILGDASHMAVLAVEVGERGRTPYLPRTARFR